MAGAGAGDAASLRSRLRSGHSRQAQNRRPAMCGWWACRAVRCRDVRRFDIVIWLVRAGERAALRRVLSAVIGACVLGVALRGGDIAIVRRAAGIPNAAQGLEGFVSAADALLTPALVAMAAVAPLGCVVGAGALMFGSRRGMVIIGASLGTLIFLGSVKGIVA